MSLGPDILHLRCGRKKCILDDFLTSKQPDTRIIGYYLLLRF